jgi:O-acetyl-ADP-ribose deacetylase (regulator of RNase III)
VILLAGLFLLLTFFFFFPFAHQKTGYNLPAKYVLHTVGPIGENPQVLESAYKTCLKVMAENGLRTLVTTRFLVSDSFYSFKQRLSVAFQLGSTVILSIKPRTLHSEQVRNKRKEEKKS